MTLGGISKASKGINLSEDIFGGFNFVLRGGNATQAEYIQVITRSLPSFAHFSSMTRIEHVFIVGLFFTVLLGGKRSRCGARTDHRVRREDQHG